MAPPSLRGVTVLLAAAGLVALGPFAPASPVLAHGDVRLVDETVELAPGASANYDGDLHYHRLVGRVEADGPVEVGLWDLTAGEVVVVAGPATTIELNELLRCCEVAWAPHRLALTNTTSVPVTVVARAAFVHDDLAVMVDGAEEGTRAPIVALAVGWTAWLARRARRPARHPVDLRRAVIGIATVVAVTVGVAALGAWRYGGTGPPALVAGGSQLPVVPFNDIVSRGGLLVLALLVGWFWSAAQWARSNADPGSTGWRLVGGLLVLAVAVAGVAMTAGYGRVDIPAAWSAVAAAPLLWFAVRRMWTSKPIWGRDGRARPGERARPSLDG